MSPAEADLSSPEDDFFVSITENPFFIRVPGLVLVMH